MNTPRKSDALRVLVCAGLWCLGVPSVSAEVNKAVRVEEWFLHNTATCQDYRLSQLSSRISCRSYEVSGRVKVRNVTAQRTGRQLVVSFRSNGGTLCGSRTIDQDLYAGGSAWFDVTCRFKSGRGSTSTPSSIEALVHQSGNVSNGVSGGTKSAPSCNVWLEDRLHGTCG